MTTLLIVGVAWGLATALALLVAVALGKAAAQADQALVRMAGCRGCEAGRDGYHVPGCPLYGQDQGA